MDTTSAARLASDLSGKTISEAKIRRLLNSGDISGRFDQGRWTVDESSVRDYFS